MVTTQISVVPFLRDAEHFSLTGIPRSILFGLMR